MSLDVLIFLKVFHSAINIRKSDQLKSMHAAEQLCIGLIFEADYHTVCLLIDLIVRLNCLTAIILNFTCQKCLEF